MKYNDVHFSDDFVKGFKTEKEFIDEMGGEGYKHIYEGKGRNEHLKKVYALHKSKDKTEKPGAEETAKTSKA